MIIRTKNVEITMLVDAIVVGKKEIYGNRKWNYESDAIATEGLIPSTWIYTKCGIIKIDGEWVEFVRHGEESIELRWEDKMLKIRRLKL